MIVKVIIGAHFQLSLRNQNCSVYLKKKLIIGFVFFLLIFNNPENQSNRSHFELKFIFGVITFTFP